MRFLHLTTRFEKSYFIVICLLLILADISQAQLLLKDIHPTGDSNPNQFIEFNGDIYFAATDANGEELWKTDGSTIGTSLVMDISNGSSSSEISEMTVVNGKLFFVATDGGIATGRELWVTDGTTTTVIDINSGTGSSNPEYLVEMNGDLYLAATNIAGGVTTGEELWKIDGITNTATMLMDINPGMGSSNPAHLTVYNNEFYFSANNGSTGVELWKSDGTPAGTVLVSDIQPGANGSVPSNFQVANGLLFFSANNGVNGLELYTTTGTGVTLIDLNPGSGNSTPTELFEYNNTLYFAADDHISGYQKLWTSDGTNTAVHPSGVRSPSDFAALNGKIFFNGLGELRILDGATIQTVNINPGGDSNPHSFATFGNRLFFIANNGNGNEIWYTDGTVTGTKMAMDVNGNSTSSSNVAELTNAAGKLVFKAEGAADGSEVRFIGDCDPARPGTTMTMVKEAGRHYSLFETTDASGWTHYCDCTNKILLSLEKGTTGAVVPTDSVSIDIEAQMVSFYFPSCQVNGSSDCFVVNENGAVIFSRTWDVKPTTQPTSDIPVRFYFSNEEYNAVNFELEMIWGMTPPSTPSEMSFYKVTNTALGQHPEVIDIKEGDAVVLTHDAAAPAVPSTTKWAYSSFGADHCSEFKVSSFSGGGGGAGESGSALPVEMMYFYARPLMPENMVKLQWATASEINNYGFFVERSHDLTNWEIIGFVGANEGGASPSEYHFKDMQPKSGDNYYRLRQQDYDGTEDYSEIAHVGMDLMIMGEIFPNPVTINATVQIDINTPVAGKATVEVFNLSRQLLLSNQHDLLQGPQLIPLDMNGLPAGMYVVKVESQGIVLNTRLLVQE